MIRISCEIGANIAKKRKQTGLTQARLAERLSEQTGEHISMHMVSCWERGLVDVPAGVLPSICHALSCSSWDLYPHSERLDERDILLMERIRVMKQDEKADLYYLLEHWQGDMRALLKLNVIHAVLPEYRRYDADLAIIEAYKEAIRVGDPNVDDRINVDLPYVLKVWHKLER